MGILFQTSFDHYTTPTYRWTNSFSSSFTMTITSVGRNSTNGFRGVFGNGTGGGLIKTLPTLPQTSWHAFAYKTNQHPPGASVRVIWTGYDQGSVQCDLRHLSDGRLRATRNGTTLGTSTAVISLNVYYHIEVKLKVDPSAGEFILWVNEVQDATLNLTSQNTRATSNSYISQMFIGATTVGNEGSPAEVNFDDVVVRDDARSGDVQVKAFFPTAVGTTNNWTPSAGTTATATDETDPNDDTDYMSTSNVNDITTFTYDDLPSTSSIVAVCLVPRSEKTDAGTASIKNVVRTGGTNYTPGATINPSNGSYSYSGDDILTTDPNTSAAWTITNFNGAEFGVKRTA